MEYGDLVSHWYEYYDTKMKKIHWMVCWKYRFFLIVSKIGAKPIKMAYGILEAREDLFRYLGLRLLVIIMKIWGELILWTRGDYIASQLLWDCIIGGWSFIIIYLMLELLMSWYFKMSLKKDKKNDECGWFQDKFSEESDWT